MQVEAWTSPHLPCPAVQHRQTLLRGTFNGVLAKYLKTDVFLLKVQWKQFTLA